MKVTKAKVPPISIIRVIILYLDVYKQSKTRINRKVLIFDSIRVLNNYNTNNIIISTSEDSDIIIWDKFSLEKVKTLKGHKKFIRSLCTNNNFIITGSLDGSIKIWDIWKNYELIHTFEENHDVNSIASCLNYIISGSTSSSNLTFYSMGEKFSKLDVNISHTTNISGLQIVENKLYSSSIYFEFKIIDLKDNFKVIHTIDDTSSKFSISTFCCNSKYIIGGGTDGEVRILQNDMRDFKLCKLYKAHNDKIRGMSISGKYFATASWDKLAKVWALDNFTLVKTIREHDRLVIAVLFKNDIMLTGGSDKLIKAWKINDNFDFIKDLTGHLDTILCLE